MNTSKSSVLKAAFAVAIPLAVLSPVVLATSAQAATTPTSSRSSVTIELAKGVRCKQSNPSTDYVYQWTCTGFNSRTAQGAPISVGLPDGWYKVEVANQTTTSWSGNDLLVTPRDRWNYHTGPTQTVSQNEKKSFSYFDAEGDWSLVSPWSVDVGSRSGDTADQAQTIITVISTRGNS